MSKNIWPDDFHCPKCHKRPVYTFAVMTRCYSARALYLPYFMCGDCRVCSYSKLLLMQTIGRWRKDNASAQAVSYTHIYRESKKALEEILTYYVKTAGYCFVRRFRKR